MEDVDLPALTRRAQQQGAIDGINRFADELTDRGPATYLQIAYDLIKEIEDDRTNLPDLPPAPKENKEQG